jgi:hypothetical protein
MAASSRVLSLSSTTAAFSQATAASISKSGPQSLHAAFPLSTRNTEVAFSAGLLPHSLPAAGVSKRFGLQKQSMILGRRARRGGVGPQAALISPDGGALVDLIVPEKDRPAKRQEASELPAINLKKIDLEWIHVLSEGWASPLTGFMRQAEYLQTLHFNAIRSEEGNLLNQSVPIVLAIDDEQKASIGDSKAVALKDSEGELVAILRK